MSETRQETASGVRECHVYELDKSDLVAAYSPEHAAETWQEQVGYPDVDPPRASAFHAVPDDRVLAIHHPLDMGDENDEDAANMRLLGFEVMAADDPERCGFWASGPASLWARHFPEVVIASVEFVE